MNTCSKNLPLWLLWQQTWFCMFRCFCLLRLSFSRCNMRQTAQWTNYSLRLFRLRCLFGWSLEFCWLVSVSPFASLPIGWSNAPLPYSLLHPLRCLLVGATHLCFILCSIRSVAYWLEQHAFALHPTPSAPLPTGWSGIHLLVFMFSFAWFSFSWRFDAQRRSAN